MNINPTPVFERDLRVVPAGPMLFCASRKISGGIWVQTGFISRIISRLDAILWEVEMFHDLSEVNLGFGHFRCD